MAISTKDVIYVVWLVALATAEANKDADTIGDLNAVLQRTKELAEDSEATDLAGMRSREMAQEKKVEEKEAAIQSSAEAEEKEALQKIRLREEDEERTRLTATRRDEATAEQNLKAAQEEKGGQSNLVDIVARQELKLAELQRRLEENNAESQKIYQRFDETQKELKETKHRLQQTQQRVKKIQMHWKSAARTLDGISAHRQKDQESPKPENPKDETSNATSRQKGIQANSIDPLATWIKETETKINALQKKDQQLRTDVNALQSGQTLLQSRQLLLLSGQNALQNELQTVKASVTHCEANAFTIRAPNSGTHYKIKFTSKFTEVPALIVAPNYAGNGNGKAVSFAVQYSGVSSKEFNLYLYTAGADGTAYLYAYWLACGN